MVTGDGPNYELQFRVIKKARALAVISDTLRSLNAGLATELCVGSRTPQKLYDNAA